MSESDAAAERIGGINGYLSDPPLTTKPPKDARALLTKQEPSDAS